MKHMSIRDFREKLHKHGIAWIPAAVFLVGAVVWAFVMHALYVREVAAMHERAHLDARIYADELQQDFVDSESMLRALNLAIANEPNHKMRNFQTVAAHMLAKNGAPLESIRLAPQGIVTEIYPEDSQERRQKFNLFQDDDTIAAIARESKNSGELTVQGPVDLQRGGQALIMRMPVFVLDNGNEKPVFWGFIIAVIKTPDIFANTVQNLSRTDFAYALEKTEIGGSSYQTVLRSEEKVVAPEQFEFFYGGSTWRMLVSPKGGWRHDPFLEYIGALSFVCLTLLTILIWFLLSLRKRQEGIRRLAVTDHLTGLLNRHGIEGAVRAFTEAKGDVPLVVVQLDIDDFKFINDVYGHAAGDAALQHLAMLMHICFPKDAILGRMGGDEFLIVLFDRNIRKMERMVYDFGAVPKEFNYGNRGYHYTVSMGYAVLAPDSPDGQTPREVWHAADVALYTIKMRGKNGCCRFAPGMAKMRNVQLGFSLRDLAIHLPAAILIYEAEDENILFANDELVKMFDCDDLDDFMAYTKSNFRGIVHPEDYDRVETSIWRQIYLNKLKGCADDAVDYRIVTKKGKIVWVIDRGRLVSSEYFGRIFYVVLIKDNEMEERMDRFS